ncbi:MAG: hypothetical protein AAB553_06975 [Patescibacteria group bacterium]
MRDIQVMGPRCSGTNVVDSMARKNFLHVRVLKTDDAEGTDNYGWKHMPPGQEFRVYVDGHWVKEDGLANYASLVGDKKNLIPRQRIPMRDPRYAGVDEAGDPYIKNNVMQPNDDDLAHTLFIVVERNPLDWLRSIHEQPHHALDLFDIRDREGLPFERFIQEPWRTWEGTAYMEDPDPVDKGKREKWKKKRVVEDQASIFVHRSESLTLFEQLQEEVPNVVFVHHEAVDRNPEQVMRQIAAAYGIERDEQFRGISTYKGQGQRPFVQKTYDPFSQGNLKNVIENIDWTVESRTGFTVPKEVQGRTEYAEGVLRNPSTLVVFDSSKQLRMYRDGELVGVDSD